MGKEWISPLVRDIPPSGIRAFFDMNTQDMISLGVGEPDFATPEHIREACIRALRRKDCHGKYLCTARVQAYC